MTDPEHKAQCGWCGKWSPLTELLEAPLTGNNWPIHLPCYVAWLGGKPRPAPAEGE